MKTTLNSRLKMLARAALFSVVAVGGMSLGLGLTTYTVAKANDYMLVGVAPEAPAAGDVKACLR